MNDFASLPSPEPVTPSPDFAEEVFHRVHRHRTFRRIRHGSFTVILLAALTGVGLQNQWKHNGPDPLAHAREGVEWLVDTQSPEGHWDAEEWGGHESFTPGVTALATLALLQAPEPAPVPSMQNALTFLESQIERVDLSRLHGPEFYNHLLSLNTLLEADALAPNPGRRTLLRANLTQLVRRQQPNGGWGYAEDQPLSYTAHRIDNANSAITWWVCHLLKKGHTLQVDGSTTALARGESWLKQRFQSAEHIAYQANSNATAKPEDALFWMAARMVSVSETPADPSFARDAYRDALRVGTLHHPHPPEDVLKTAMARKTQHRDRWWKAGGKVYVTAANVISLVPRGGV